MEDESGGIPVQVNHKPEEVTDKSPLIVDSSEIKTDTEESENKTDLVKVNGDKYLEESDTGGEADSSDCDALVIDESVKPKRIKRAPKLKSPMCKGFEVTHSNPYFNESLFELSQLHHTLLDLNKNKPNETITNKSNDSIEPTATNNLKQRKNHKKNNPKLREYAQYLGLQPSVQFKCNKCYRTGFPSLSSLNEHLMQCTSETPAVPPAEINSSSASSTNIRVRRKVFLCSACGTYYENWNLFLHMCEVHKRYICLYCLGMFSHSEDLSNHLTSKHNCAPRKIQAVQDFVNIYPEPLFLMCCDCQKVFNERDNYFHHKCFGVAKKFVNKTSKQNKQSKTHVEHVTGDDNIETTVKDTSSDNTSVNLKDSKSPDEADKPQPEIEENSTKTMETNETDLSNLEEKNFEQEASDEKSEENFADEDNCDKPEENETNEYPEEPPHQSAAKDPTENCLSGEETKNTSEPECAEPDVDESFENADETKETRKVPKVTLRLPKPGSYPEIKDTEESDNLTMEVDQEQNENDEKNEVNSIKEVEETQTQNESQMQIAGPDVSIVELELEQPLDKFEIRTLIQKCLRATVPVCIYCNHARKIAVNGKQLALHAIAEHRYSAVVNSITAEELIPESFVARIKESLSELENVYFNLESTLNDEGVTFSHVFECFQCRYSTTVHKELYLHNRKSHAKTILLCIMCKSNFYSYSELICHLCPGLYVLESDVQFRCCMCVSDDLPSAFRLMVHLRKRHHVCDVCLELCHNQSRLSNHVWKHKLHHLCYRCGIAYRNKPDITKHLFWKHGTESVLCKKCLQKKWPHVYHFCIPPTSFVCEECNLTFTRAVSLKVHKRIHSETKPHACSIDNCTESFISKKLLLKHEFKHREPPEEQPKEIPEDDKKVDSVEEPETKNETEAPQEVEKIEEKPVEKPKPKVDVYDLPALNLSESDSSDSEDEEKKPKPEAENKEDKQETEKIEMEVDGVDKPKIDDAEVENPAPVLENIWDDFKNYQASKEKFDNILTDPEKVEPEPSTSSAVEEQINQIDIIMQDHDYCYVSEPIKDNLNEVAADLTQSLDHDYCSPKGQMLSPQQKIEELKPEEVIVEGKVPKKKIDGNTSSSSSSDSDSSSCTCGSNCSCSSSSGSSSSSDSSDSDSSTSEGRRKQQARREKRKEKQKNKNKENPNTVVDVVATDNNPPLHIEAPIQESDLETTESETDEDFYDKQPQKLAKKILAEKRNQLLAEIGPIANGSLVENSRPSTPSLPEEEVKPKKKSKSKKRKKKKSSKYEHAHPVSNPEEVPSNYQFYQTPAVAPLTLSLSRNSPVPTAVQPNVVPNAPNFDNFVTTPDSDSSLRASKRRRVPNKFYGYSSEEEQEKAQPPQPKWRKADLPSPARQVTNSPLLVPPITIKTVPTPQPTVEPVTIRTANHSSEMRIQQTRPPIPTMRIPPQRPPPPPPPPTRDNDSDSNESNSADEPQPPLLMHKENQPALYCYCRCPYDEVSEMIGCDSSDCAIEWFHFECVGIMVPPKGQWFCPDCRKKKQQRKDLLQT